MFFGLLGLGLIALASMLGAPMISGGTGDPRRGLDSGVWPMKIISLGGQVYRPEVSQEYHAGHNGVDIMYRRKSGGDRSDYPAHGHWGSKGYFIPGDQCPVYAVADGIVSVSAMTARGWNIVIDHKTHATYYQHCHSPSKHRKGDTVRKGDVIAFVFYNSADDSEQLAHLHFEIWHGGAASHVDPAPFLNRWTHHA